MTNRSIILAENEAIFSPVSQVNYEFYTDKKDLLENLTVNESIQCIVNNEFIAFGSAQKPSLSDYADGIDTMKFITELN